MYARWRSLLPGAPGLADDLLRALARNGNRSENRGPQGFFEAFLAWSTARRSVFGLEGPGAERHLPLQSQLRGAQVAPLCLCASLRKWNVQKEDPVFIFNVRQGEP